VNELGAGVGALFFVVVLVVGIGGLAFWIVALIDCIKFSDEVYRAAGSEKVTWVLIVALAGWIGGLIYWFSIRSRLHEVERSGVAAVAPWYAPDCQVRPARCCERTTLQRVGDATGVL